MPCTCLTTSCFRSGTGLTEIPGGGTRGRLHTAPHCYHHNDSSQRGSGEIHFNVSLTGGRRGGEGGGDVKKAMSMNHNFPRERRTKTKFNRSLSAYQHSHQIRGLCVDQHSHQVRSKTGLSLSKYCQKNQMKVADEPVVIHWRRVQANWRHPLRSPLCDKHLVKSQVHLRPTKGDRHLVKSQVHLRPTKGDRHLVKSQVHLWPAKGDKHPVKSQLHLWPAKGDKHLVKSQVHP